MVGAGIQTAHLNNYNNNNKLYQAHTAHAKTSLLLSEMGVSTFFFFFFVVSLHNIIETKPTHILYIPT